MKMCSIGSPVAPPHAPIWFPCVPFVRLEAKHGSRFSLGHAPMICPSIACNAAHRNLFTCCCQIPQTHKCRRGDLLCQTRPVDARTYGLCRLAVGQILPKLEHRHHGQPPGLQCGLAVLRVEVEEILVRKDRAELIAQRQVRIPPRKGGLRHMDGRFRNSLYPIRFE